MQPIEGFTPDMLWTFLIVLIGLGALIILGDKVRGVFANASARKQAKKPELADEISSKVLAKLEPRFAEIDRKLANDKLTIDTHTRQIDELGKRYDGANAGQKALCRGILALLNHEITGNSVEKLKEARANIDEYLIDK